VLTNPSGSLRDHVLPTLNNLVSIFFIYSTHIDTDFGGPHCQLGISSISKRRYSTETPDLGTEL
jgi:hypothetical protein